MGLGTGVGYGALKITIQCSKLRPFWSPWRVEKIFGDQNSGESRVMAANFTVKGGQKATF